MTDYKLDANELYLYAKNTGKLYPQRVKIETLMQKHYPILRDSKIKWGIQLQWMSWLNKAVQAYRQEFNYSWINLGDWPKLRILDVANQFYNEWEAELEIGNKHE